MLEWSGSWPGPITSTFMPEEKLSSRGPDCHEEELCERLLQK